MNNKKKLSILYVAHFVGLALGIITLPYSLHFIGYAEMGRVAYGASAFLIAGLFLDCGLDTWLSGEIARQHKSSPARCRYALQLVVGLRLALLTLLILTLLVFSWWFETYRTEFLVIGLSMLPLLMTPWSPLGLSRGYGFQTSEAVVTLIVRAAAAFAVFGMVPMFPHAETVAAITGGSGLLGGLTTLGLLHRNGIPIVGMWPSMARCRKTLRIAAHLMTSRYFGAVYSYLPAPLLGAISGAEAAGAWQVAERIMRAASQLLAPLANVYYPKMAALAKNGTFVDTNVRETLVRNARRYVALAFFFMAGMLFLALLNYEWHLLGERITKTIALLGIATFTLVLNSFLVYHILLPCGKDRALMQATGGGAAAFVLSVLPLTLTYAENGMAISYALAELASLAVYLNASKKAL